MVGRGLGYSIGTLAMGAYLVRFQRKAHFNMCVPLSPSVLVLGAVLAGRGLLMVPPVNLTMMMIIIFYYVLLCKLPVFCHLPHSYAWPGAIDLGLPFDREGLAR